MIYDWYLIFNTDEFDDAGLVSQTVTLVLEGIGQKDFLVTKGELYGITLDNDFLALNQLDANPFEFEGNAIYIDENNDVWWGMANEA